jgi:hypothetical protein
VLSQNCGKRLLTSSYLNLLNIKFVISVCLYDTIWLSLDCFSLNSIFNIFRKSVEKIQISLNLARITGTLHEDLHTVMITSCCILLRIRNISDKFCGEILVCSIQGPPRCTFLCIFYSSLFLTLHVSSAICTHPQEHNCSVQP